MSDDREFSISQKQGDLDGLCGLYAVINAIQNLENIRLCDDDCAELFEKGIWYLHDYWNNHNFLPDAIINGMSIGPLLNLSRYLAKFQSQKMDSHEICVERIALNAGNISGVWSAIRDCTDKGGCAIVAVHGQHNHWTCVVKATERQIKLRDSGCLKQFNKANCTSGEVRGNRINVFDEKDIVGIFAREI